MTNAPAPVPVEMQMFDFVAFWVMQSPQATNCPVASGTVVLMAARVWVESRMLVACTDPNAIG